MKATADQAGVLHASDAHFFQVVEQRGAVRVGKIQEYQVLLNVTVES